MELKWDQIGTKEIYAGVSKAVLFPRAANGSYEAGVAWSGMREISVDNDGGDANKLYADNRVFFMSRKGESKQITLTYYMYPDEWLPCDGYREVAPGVVVSQQKRKPFGICWRREIHSDGDENINDYELNLAYGCTANPTDIDDQTDEDDLQEVEWETECETEPVEVDGYLPFSFIRVRKGAANATKFAELERILYGTADTAARMPLPEELIRVLSLGNNAATYTAVTPSSGDNPVSKGWYEKDGTTYTLSTDTSVVSGKTYYTVSV